MKLNKKLIFLYLILILGIFLRFYKINDLMPFNGEIGDNYINVKNLISDGEIPLVGPPTSHEWLKFGPLAYWILGIVLYLADFNPKSGIYFSEIMGVITFFFVYFVVKDIIKEKTGLIAALLTSLSPQLIFVNAESRFYSWVIPLSVIYLFLVIRMVKGKKRQIYFLIMGFLMGIMIHLHYAAIILLLGSLFSIFYCKIKISRKQFFAFFLGLNLLLLPFVINAIVDKNLMLIKFGVWIPYKLFQFININNGMIGNGMGATIQKINGFLFNNFIIGHIYSHLIFFLGLIFLVIKYIRIKNIAIKIILIHLISAICLLFIHQKPENHYFVPIQLIPIMLIAKFLGGIKKKISIVLITAMFISITYINSNYFFSENWFYQNTERIITGRQVAFKLQEKLADAIIKDANGRSFNLKRVGDFDYYKDNYAQNYIYLLWRRGNEPKKNADLSYTIYENLDLIPKDYKNGEYINVANSIILKN